MSNTSECVVCFQERADTKQICDCKSLVMCKTCQYRAIETTVRYQALTCPICDKRFTNIRHTRQALRVTIPTSFLVGVHTLPLCPLLFFFIGSEHFRIAWCLYVAFLLYVWMQIAFCRAAGCGCVQEWTVTSVDGMVTFERKASVMLM